MSNYPPGVTGNEPQITGEWPCDECDGMGYFEDEDGKDSCKFCEGTGIYPENGTYAPDLEALIRNKLREVTDEVDFELDNDGMMVVYLPFRKYGSNYKEEDR
jgi:DnaJ-class molecular chaperone